MDGNRTRWAVVVGALMVLPFVAACGSSNKTASSSTTAAAAPTTAAPTSPPTTSPPPTSAPTTTTTPFDSKYGTFAPTSHSGSSDAVVPIPAGAKAGLVAATHTGSGHFAVEALDAENKMVDLLANEVGAYSGTTAFGFGISSKAPVNLKVTASSGWTMKISPISSAPVLASPASGKGDAVYLWNGKATNWDIKNTGDGHFAVSNQGSGVLSYDLLVNEVGSYHGTVPVKSGPAVTMITSDGTWSITFS
jgi:hypothetical protein